MQTRRLLTAISVVALSASAYAAAGLSVRKTTSITDEPQIIWKKIGAFCAIQDWHPAVETCVTSDDNDETFRTLTLKDGGTIKEKLTGMTDTGYTYAIIESPLPVKDYSASFSARPDFDQENRTIVSWSSNFAARDKPDSEAKQVIDGIFGAGLESIAKSYGSN